MKKKSFPIIVLDEHPDWLNPLYEEFRKRNVPYQKVDINSAFYDAQESAISPFYINRLSPSAGKRGHDASFTYAYNYLKHLEKLGARIINGSHTVLLETNKAEQSALLHQLHISQPRTIVLNDIRWLKQAADKLRYPLIVKPNRGGSGMNMKKFETQNELETAITNNEIPLPSDNLLLLQEYIQPKDGYIVRVEVINKKVVYGMKVYTKGTFNLCPSDSCDLQRDSTDDDLGYCVATPTEDVRFELYEDLPKSVVSAIEKIVRTADLECAGIEYVVDKDDNWYIYDINALSILRSSFKEEYGIDAWGQLADYFITEYKKVVK